LLPIFYLLNIIKHHFSLCIVVIVVIIAIVIVIITEIF